MLAASKCLERLVQQVIESQDGKTDAGNVLELVRTFHVQHYPLRRIHGFHTGGQIPVERFQTHYIFLLRQRVGE
jgi:hypothetical protein